MTVDVPGSVRVEVDDAGVVRSLTFVPADERFAAALGVRTAGALGRALTQTDYMPAGYDADELITAPAVPIQWQGMTT